MSIEAGTWLAGIIVVVRMYVAPVDGDKIVYELNQGGFLCGCPCVGSLPGIIKPSDVADADTMRVVPDTMSSGAANRSAAFDSAVEAYDIVISYILPSSPVGFGLCVPLFNLFGSHIDLRPSGRAVYDYIIYHSHSH